VRFGPAQQVLREFVDSAVRMANPLPGMALRCGSSASQAAESQEGSHGSELSGSESWIAAPDLRLPDVSHRGRPLDSSRRYRRQDRFDHQRE
jgi:hypothetical protein